VTRREGDIIAGFGIPTGDDEAAGIGIRLDLADQTRDLVDAVACRVFAAERAPQITVDRFYDIPNYYLKSIS